MAFNLTDFDKIWASSSPLTPYSFTDSNYEEGWNFIGSTPPSRQMWDYYMNLADQKNQWLYNNTLQLAGGTMTGEIRTNWGNGSVIANSDSNSDSGVAINGGYSDTTGGQIILVGENNANNSGAVIIRPRTSNGYVEFVAKPDGDLLWNGKKVERVNASGSNYIRYENGLQICWGTSSTVTTNAGTSTTTKITFPVAFKNTDYVVSFVDSFNSGDWGNHSFSTSTYSTTGVWLYLQNNKTAAYTYALKWVAIGYWQ